MIRQIEKLVKWFEDFFDLSSSGRSDNDNMDLDQAPFSEKGKSSQPLSRYRFRRWLLFLSRRRGLILRSLLCWGFGLLALQLDEVSNYDFRLALRGNQSIAEDIVILAVSTRDLEHYFHKSPNVTKMKAEPSYLADEAYWDRNVWHLMISELLELEPKGIGVTFFFDDRIKASLTSEDWPLFTNHKVIWMGALSQGGLFQFPPFAITDLSNFGYGDFTRDEDGIMRSVLPLSGVFKPFSLRLSELSFNRPDFNYPLHKSIINFRGSSQTIRTINLSDFLERRISREFLTNKIVLIGSADDHEHYGSFATPVGSLTRTELLAHIIDNNIHQRWIHRIHQYLSYFELFLVMLFAVVIMHYFPQKVAFIFLSLLGMMISALSLWCFDTYQIWTPAFSPLMEILGTWILFVGYMASRMERKNWQLQQEKKSLAQLEQLKNNFISLISHDLKTPIAKIQAIVDRLLLNNSDTLLTPDLKSLRSSSQELHRYIQSILKILRVESREFHLHLEVADINDLLEKAIHQILPLAKEKNIKIHTQLEPLFSVEVDGALLQEVFANILENAVKYTLPGGSVFVSTNEENDLIQVQVQDTGEGIAADDLSNVFGKFVRGKNQDLKSKGTGLGLYLVKYFIELHGGRVSLKSQIGKGTTVDLYLPTVSQEN